MKIPISLAESLMLYRFRFVRTGSKVLAAERGNGEEAAEKLLVVAAPPPSLLTPVEQNRQL